MKLKISRILSVSLLSFALLTSWTIPAFAASASSTTATPTTSDAAQQLKVSPIRTDISIAAGQTGTVKVGVTNLATVPVTVQPIENDFVASGENGAAALILDPNSYAPTHSLKRFMVALGTTTIPANSTVAVTVTIKVPKNAQAGGYFGAVRFTPAVGDVNSSGAAIGESVASLILLTVPGPTAEQLTMTDFSVQQNGSTASNFRNGQKLNLFIRFQNKGNIQEAPFGQIDVQKGKKVLFSYNFNQDTPKDEILPDSARRWTIPLKGFGGFGKYVVSGTFSYGSTGQTIEISKTVWIIPTLYILIVVIVVGGLLVVGGGSYLFLRNYKRKILKSSRRRY